MLEFCRGEVLNDNKIGMILIIMMINENWGRKRKGRKAIKLKMKDVGLKRKWIIRIALASTTYDFVHWMHDAAVSVCQTVTLTVFIIRLFFNDLLSLSELEPFGVVIFLSFCWNWKEVTLLGGQDCSSEHNHVHGHVYSSVIFMHCSQYVPHK